MKYALESIPDLIGERQFRDLCTALGKDPSGPLPSGTEFAEWVASGVLKYHRDCWREQQRHGAATRALFAQHVRTGNPFRGFEWMADDDLQSAFGIEMERRQKAMAAQDEGSRS